MLDREAASRKIQEHYESVWKQADPWGFHSSEFDQARYDRQLSLLADRRYNRALEIGCGSGNFSRMLAAITNRLLALDVADAAIKPQKLGAAPECRVSRSKYHGL